MIDEEWLKQLRFEMPNGIKVTGFLGTGGTTIILEAITPEGKPVALRVERFNLAWHLKEIPSFLTSTPRYDLHKLNEKIFALVGQSYFEDMTGLYYYVYEAMLRLLKESGVQGLLARVRDTSMGEAIPLFLCSPALRSRLVEIASLPSRVPWQVLSRKEADLALREIAGLKLSNNLNPEFLRKNPLYVWGGAVMDSVYSDADIPHAAAFVRDRYGKIIDNKLAATIIGQAGAVADFAAQVLDQDVRPFLKFCKACGVILVVFDREGKLVGEGPN